MARCCRLEDNVEQRDHNVDQFYTINEKMSHTSLPLANGSGLSVGHDYFRTNTIIVSASNVV